jgi:hypothetical protein
LGWRKSLLELGVLDTDKHFTARRKETQSGKTKANDLGPDRACKVRAWVRLGLYTACLGFCGSDLAGRLGVWTAGLAQKTGPHGLGLLGYVVKVQARSSP